MQKTFYFLLITISMGCSNSSKTTTAPSSTFIGNFKDDYGIQYRISPKQFIQEPRITYTIIEWNTAEQYFITQNDASNPSEPSLYTRIDYMELKNMAPYTWGFCYTIYNAASVKIAKETAAADRSNPKKGCGGYPFSRMKKMN